MTPEQTKHAEDRRRFVRMLAAFLVDKSEQKLDLAGNERRREMWDARPRLAEEWCDLRGALGIPPQQPVSEDDARRFIEELFANP